MRHKGTSGYFWADFGLRTAKTRPHSAPVPCNAAGKAAALTSLTFRIITDWPWSSDGSNEEHCSSRFPADYQVIRAT
jgi:hypothetical protein